MERMLKISLDHPSGHQVELEMAGKAKTIYLKLIGGSPYFGYIWIDDVCYTVTQTSRSIQIKKTKRP